MEIFYALIAVTVLFLLFFIAFKVLIFIMKLITQTLNNSHHVVNNSMEEGDYHSGPDGYTPNTSYPESHYGDIYNNDEEDEHH